MLFIIIQQRSYSSHRALGVAAAREQAVMSDEKPDLGDLAIELDSLTWAEARTMAVMLQVEYSGLKKIEEKGSDTSWRLLATMNLWLQTDSRASWGRVVKALRDTNKTVLAKELEDKYCKKPASPLSEEGKV